MDTKALRQKILDLAIRGKLVPQDPNDEPASILLERIHAEKQQMVKDGRLKAKDVKNDTVIFVGEDLDVLIELCDRILVIGSGKITGIVDGRTADKSEIGLLMTKTDGGAENE